MLRSILELMFPPQFRLALARMSVVAASIVLLACGILMPKATPEHAVAVDRSPAAADAQISEDFPGESKGDSESEKDAELEADTQSLFYTGLATDQRCVFIHPSQCNTSAFLPLRSREIGRELFRPPQA